MIYIHKKTGKRYSLVDDKAKVKHNGEWEDAVLYSPLYESDTRMFCRLKKDFETSFEYEDKG